MDHMAGVCLIFKETIKFFPSDFINLLSHKQCLKVSLVFVFSV